MPVDTSGIQTIINAFLQGQHLANEARQNVMRAEQFKIAQENEAEDRKLRLQALTEQIKRSTQAHDLELEAAKLAKKKYDFDVIKDFETGYAQGIRKLPNSQMHEEVSKNLIPNFLARPDLLPSPQSNETQLTPEEEVQFQLEKAARFPNDTGEDYDLRGAWKAGLLKDESGHLPDTFKKPNHPTFSNESMYAGRYPEHAGEWMDDTFIPPQIRQAINPVDTSGRMYEAETRRQVPNEMVTIPGTDIQIPSSSLVDPRDNPNLQLKEDALDIRLKMHADALTNAIEKQKIADKANMAELDKRITSQEKIAGNRNTTQIIIADKRIEAADRRAKKVSDLDRKDAKFVINDSHKYEDVLRKYDISQLKTGWQLTDKVLKTGTLDSAEQFQLIYAFIKEADRKTGVKDAEFENVRKQMSTLLQRVGTLGSNFTADGKQIISDSQLKQMASAMKRQEGNTKKELDREVKTFRYGPKHKLGLSDEEIQNYYPHPYKDEEGESETPKIDWSKVKGVKVN